MGMENPTLLSNIEIFSFFFKNYENMRILMLTILTPTIGDNDRARTLYTEKVILES